MIVYAYSFNIIKHKLYCNWFRPLIIQVYESYGALLYDNLKKITYLGFETYSL